MKRLFAIFLLLTACAQFPRSSKDTYLFKIDDQTVESDEFIYAYSKNNFEKDSVDLEKDIREYLELYINFKLKVAEAKSLGLDTSRSYKTELEGYRQQLAAPYLTESSVTDQLLREAYERLKYEVRASHILVSVSPTASAEDTLNSYKYLTDVRNRAINGEDFSELAKQYSQDPSAARNAGDLGYFTGLQMVYPFEEAAFTTDIGSISPIIKTRFGYHIIKVIDRRKSRGQIKVSHIIIRAPDNLPKADSAIAKSKIDEIRRLVVDETLTWDEACVEFSEDVNSKNSGGKLPWLGAGSVPPNFENAAFALEEPGQLSEPIKTSFGWHIIKLDDKKGIETFEALQDELKMRIQRDSRSELSKKAFIQRVKKENNFMEMNYDKATAVVDSTFLQGKWSKPASNPADSLFTIGSSVYTFSEFYSYLEKQQRPNPNMDLAKVLKSQYDNYVELSLTKYEEDHLADNYFDYKMLYKEYAEGIILFQLMDQKVWSNAVKDTTGLMSFFEENQQNYMGGELIQGMQYNLASDSLRVLLQTILDSNDSVVYSNNDLKSYFNRNSNLNLLIEQGPFEENDPLIKILPEKKPGVYNLDINNRFYLLIVDKVDPPAPRPLEDIRGLVISDYQEYLEDAWVKELRSTYSVDVNKDVLENIIVELESK